MRFVALFLVLWAFAGAAGAESLTGSDRKTYATGIRLYSATLGGDEYATVTGRVLMKGSLAAPVRLFADVGGLPGWIENLAVAKEVGQRALTDRTLYMRFSAPAGFDDRDGLMRFVAARQAPGIIILTLQDVPGYPPQANAVRMSDVRGRFRVEQAAEGVLAVEFRLHYDSDARPVTLANMGVKRQVEQTLVRMKQRIEGPLRNARAEGPLARSLGLQ